MKRVLVDQGSVVEIMYPNLYKGLNLKPENLTTYDSPLVSFEEKTVTSKCQIRLPIPSGPGAHYRRLQEFIGPSGPIGPRREVEAATAPF